MKKQNTILTAIIITLFFVVISPVNAQLVLFDFNNAPLHSSLPLDQTAGGITAHLSATGTGYSIQNADAFVINKITLILIVFQLNFISKQINYKKIFNLLEKGM